MLLTAIFIGMCESMYNLYEDKSITREFLYIQEGSCVRWCQKQEVWNMYKYLAKKNKEKENKR